MLQQLRSARGYLEDLMEWALLATLPYSLVVYHTHGKKPGTLVVS